MKSCGICLLDFPLTGICPQGEQRDQQYKRLSGMLGQEPADKEGDDMPTIGRHLPLSFSLCKVQNGHHFALGDRLEREDELFLRFS